MLRPESGMPSRRVLSLLAASVLIVIFLLYSLDARESWTKYVSEAGLGGLLNDGNFTTSDESIFPSNNTITNTTIANTTIGDVTPEFESQNPIPSAELYDRTLVIARTMAENVSWIEEHFGEDTGLRQAIYVADDPEAPLHTPENKGHEVMVYLTYIIDNYDDLTDINIFMHAHRFTWHNDDLLKRDAVKIIRQLSTSRVQREGYMNLRCGWRPGCPSWMHPTKEKRPNKEEKNLAMAWPQLFPEEPVPDVLAQPCCGQFAVSRDRLHSLPVEEYMFFREWLSNTTLTDYYSGRVWEYLWQYVFTGQNVFCPAEHTCFCDGYGVCFNGEKPFEEVKDAQKKKRKLEAELSDMLDEEEEQRVYEGALVRKRPRKSDPDRDEVLRAEILELESWIDAEVQKAEERGQLLSNRELEAGYK